MSRNEHTSDLGSIDLSDDRARAVEEAGRRAGAALRSPAPAHGATAIQGQAHRRRVVRVAATTAGLGVLLVAGVMAIRPDDGSVKLQPSDTPPNTDSTTPNSTSAPSTIETTTTNPPVATGSFEVVEAGTIVGGPARYIADGSLILVEDGQVLFHDAATLTQVRELPCPTRLETLPESLGTGPSADWVWDVEAAAQWDEEALSVFKPVGVPHTDLCSVTVSADGSRALSSADVEGDVPAGGRRRLLWDTSDGSLVVAIAGAWPVFNADGSRLVTLDGTSLTLWDTSTGAVVTTISDFPPDTSGAAISPDGTRVLRWGGTDGGGTVVDATIYDVQTLTSVATLSTGSRRDVLAQQEAVFDTAGRLATLDAAGVTIWDASTGTELHHVPVELAPEHNSLAISPDGAMIAVSHGDRITIFNSSSGAQLADLALGPDTSSDGVVFSADGSSLAANVEVGPPEERVVRVWFFSQA